MLPEQVQGAFGYQKNYRRTAHRIKRGGMYVALVFSQSASGGKILPSVRKAPGKSIDFQISADFFLRNENPQIFIASVKKPFFDTQMLPEQVQGAFF